MVGPRIEFYRGAGEELQRMWIETISGQSRGGENRVNKRGAGHFIAHSSCDRKKRPK